MAAASINSRAFSSERGQSNGMEPACTTAARTVDISISLIDRKEARFLAQVYRRGMEAVQLREFLPARPGCHNPRERTRSNVDPSYSLRTRLEDRHHGAARPSPD